METNYRIKHILLLNREIETLNYSALIKVYIGFYLVLMSFLSVLYLNYSLGDVSKDLNIHVQVFSLFLFLTYSSSLLLLKYFDSQSYNWMSLSTIYLFFAIPVVFMMLLVLFMQTGDLFPYYGTDQIYYDNQARFYADYDLRNTINHFVETQRWWDLGTVLFVRFFYILWDSQLIIRIVNIIIVWGIAITMFELARIFMPKKYAFWATSCFMLSSFTFYIMASSNKEPLLILVVLVSLYLITKFVLSKNNRYLLYLALPIFLLIFLRPYLISLILAAVLITFTVGKKDAITKFTIISISSIAFIAVIPQIIIAYNRFFGNIERFLMVNQDIIFHSLPVTLISSVVLGLIGPLPTFFAFSPNEGLSYYSSGLLFRNLSGFIFICGSVFIILKRKTELLPITVFCLLEMFSLGIVLESFELRKSLPHFPYIFIIVFYFLYKLKSIKPLYTNKLIALNYMYIISLFIIIVLWNLRLL